MEPGPGEEETKIPEPSSSSAQQDASTTTTTASGSLSCYESQKRRDWNTFQQYLRNHKPPLILGRCSEAYVFSLPCACPLRQAWGSLDALIGRLCIAFDENHRPGHPDSNPFTARACIYLREVRESQAKACGIPYQKKKKKKRKPSPPPTTTTVAVGTQEAGAGSSAAAAPTHVVPITSTV